MTAVTDHRTEGTTLLKLTLARIGWSLAKRLPIDQLSTHNFSSWEEDIGIRFTSLDGMLLVEEHVRAVLLEQGREGERSFFKVEMLHITAQSQLHYHERCTSFFHGDNVPRDARVYKDGVWAPMTQRFSLAIKPGEAHAFDASRASRSFYLLALSTPPFESDDVVTL